MNSTNIFVLCFGHIQMGWAEQKAQQISLFFVNVLILVAAALLKGYLCKCSFHALLEGNVFLLDLSCLHTMAQMGESLGTCIWDFLQWFSCSELSASSCGDRIWLLSDSRKEQGLPAVLGFSLRQALTSGRRWIFSSSFSSSSCFSSVRGQEQGMFRNAFF